MHASGDICCLFPIVVRLTVPGSERCSGTKLSELPGADNTFADPHVLYRCHYRLLAPKEALFAHVAARWRDLFNVAVGVLLHDLTSTYFESDPPLDDE